MSVRAEPGDMLEVIPRLVAEGVVCDACVCDPPYHLGPTQKRFGAANSAPAQYGKDGAMARLSSGFMGKKWDGGDIAFRPETWATVATILRPGAFLLAFGGTRTYHRLVCAIEDAGFIVQDQIAWVFGSGFPKRKDMLKPAWETVCVAQKPYDVQALVSKIGSKVDSLWSQLWSMLPAKDATRFLLLSPRVDRTANGPLGSVQTNVSESPEALRAGLSAQMGTHQFELAVLGSLSTVSSWSGTLAETYRGLSTSTIKTKLNTTIDWKTWNYCLSRITAESIILAHKNGHWSNAHAGPAARFFSDNVQRLGTILEPSAPEIAIDWAPIERLGADGVEIEPICLAYKPGGKRSLQVDECRIAAETIRTVQTPSRNAGTIYGADQRTRIEFINDEGRWPANLCHDGSDEVLETFPDAPGQLYAVGPQHGDRKSVNCYGDWGPRPLAVPRRDSEASANRRYADVGSTDFAALPGARREDGGSSARFFYCAKADAQDRWGSKHPTVKPVELMKWLVPLVTPPGGLVLDCFAGSGTTGLAAFATGRDAILIEREPEYIADIEARLAYWRGEGPSALSVKARRVEQKLGDLFA